MVTSTKTGLQRPWVEFIIGNESLIKGFDRAMPKMSYGERAKLFFTPTYAYGPEGLPPIIPPDSHMMFDVTVLGFRQRKDWIKPMIQVCIYMIFLLHCAFRSTLYIIKSHLLLLFAESWIVGETIHGRGHR